MVKGLCKKKTNNKITNWNFFFIFYMTTMTWKGLEIIRITMREGGGGGIWSGTRRFKFRLL